MSLFGRNRNFGFSRGLGDALARPAYLNALGQVGMLAGSLPQRRKEQQRQAEEMKILQSGDPQQIINYSLAEAARLNSPELLAAAQQAQTRFETQNVTQQMQSLATTLANPLAKNKDGQLLGDDPSALNSLADQIRQLATTNDNIPQGYDEQLITNARANRSASLGNRAKGFVSQNPELTSDAAREAFVFQYGQSAGAEFDSAFIENRRQSIDVETIDFAIRERDTAEQRANLSAQITSKVESGDIEGARADANALRELSLSAGLYNDAEAALTVVDETIATVTDAVLANATLVEKAQKQAINDAWEKSTGTIMLPEFTGSGQALVDATFQQLRQMPGYTIDIEKELQDKWALMQKNLSERIAAENAKEMLDRDIEYANRNMPRLMENPEFETAYNLYQDLLTREAESKREGSTTTFNVGEQSALQRVTGELTKFVQNDRDTQNQLKRDDTSIELASISALNDVVANVPALENVVSTVSVEDQNLGSGLRYSQLLPEFLGGLPMSGQSKFQLIKEIVENGGADGDKRYDELLLRVKDIYRQELEKIPTNTDNLGRREQQALTRMRYDIVERALDSMNIYDPDDKKVQAAVAQQQVRVDSSINAFHESVIAEILQVEAPKRFKNFDIAKLQRGEYPKEITAQYRKYISDPELYANVARRVFEEAQLELQLFRGQILGRAPSAIERRQGRVRQNVEDMEQGRSGIGFDTQTGQLNERSANIRANRAPNLVPPDDSPEILR